MGGRLYTYYRKRSPTDATAATLRAERGPWVGISLPLEPTEDSPFLGDIRPGETQSSLETMMYRAPVFPHKVALTDFLLVRSPKGKLSLRRIDSVHVVGQQVLLPSPGSYFEIVSNRHFACLFWIVFQLVVRTCFRFKPQWSMYYGSAIKVFHDCVRSHES